MGGSAAGMNKTFTTGLRPMENRQTALAGVGKALPLWWLRHHLSPRESVSLGSQVAITPLRTKFACHPAVRGHN